MGVLERTIWIEVRANFVLVLCRQQCLRAFHREALFVCSACLALRLLFGFPAEHAMSCRVVARFSAARLAPAFRKPCAEQCGRPASAHRSLNQLPKLSFVKGAPRDETMYVKSPVRAAAMDRA